MAIRQPRLAKDYWPRRKQTALLAIILGQVVALAGTTVVLYFGGVIQENPLVFASILVVQMILGVVSSIILYNALAAPLKALLAAVIHVSGEPTITTPPNPNRDDYEKSGFKDVLQTIYALASQETPTQTPVQTTNDSAAPATTTQVTVSAVTGLEAALNSSSSGFVIMDQARTITYCNRATPISIDASGKKTLELMFNGSDTLDAWLDECQQHAVKAEKIWHRIAHNLPDADERRFFDVLANYNKGAEAEVILTLVDRTADYTESEQALDFIAFAAHELRGPITVIRGYLDVLQDELKENLDEEHIELFHRLTVSANRLSGYINNILNTSRYDRRHLKMHLVESTYATVYDMIKDDMAMRANAQGRVLSVAIPTDLPTIPADPASLSEVMGNLIDNAIKYSNEGGIINVTAALKDDRVELTVEDHGIGMPGNVISNLFQKFYRSHRSRETVAGTGIGLYISKAIVESHGGTIGVRSEEGKGSAFTVALPLYRNVADALKADNNSNEGMIKQDGGWIKNHSMYRG